MKTLHHFYYCLFAVVLFAACNMPAYEPSVTALQGGSSFVDACLKGDFDKAAFYMIQDSANSKKLLAIKRDYSFKSADEKRNYSTASIIIYSDEAINDSIHIINYANSYDKVARKLKVINRNDKWLVDFKYTFSGNF